jgi:uncharacterized protein (TIGR03437 family)
MRAARTVSGDKSPRRLKPALHRKGGPLYNYDTATLMRWGRYIVLLAAFGLHAARGQVSFAPAAIYAAQKAPLWITTGDFNGDGKLDLAVANGGSESIDISLGNGDGTFQASVPYAAGVSCVINYLVTGDFNNDGKQDLLVGCLAGTTLAVLPGKGDGTFGAAILTQLPLTMVTGDVVDGGTVQSAVADFDQDGNLDIAMLLGTLTDKNLSGEAAYLLRGLGNGTFQAPQPIAALAGMEAVSFATADFNGDGKPDLAALVLHTKPDSANLVIALGQGDGTFRVSGSYPSQVVFNLTVGDVNGDGVPDLVLSGGTFESDNTNVTAEAAVYTGNGDGTFQLKGSYASAPGSIIFDLCLADVRGTGKPDIAALLYSGIVNNDLGSANASVVLMAGNGDGTFQNPVTLMPFDGAASFSIVSGDFNGDGRPDLAFPTIPDSALATLPDVDLDNLPTDLPPALEGFPDSSTEVLLNTTPPSTFSDANAAGFQRGTMAQDSIIAAFGGGLASTTAQTGALGTMLGGVTVTVQDSAGTSRLADLFYVSPTQINYAMPAGTATGQAAITIANGPATVTVNQQIGTVLPGIFAVDGIAAANVQTYQNGQLTAAALSFQVASNGAVTPLPIDVSTGQVFVLLYGTGIRHASSVTVNLGSQTGLPVAYAGAQGVFVGEDQINVLLPQTLQGAGTINVTLTADGQTSNIVQLQIE